MHLVVVLDDSPVPARSGNRNVLKSELEALSKRFEVSAICFTSDHRTKSYLERICVRFMTVPREPFGITTFRAPLTPYQAASRRLRKSMLRELATWPEADVIVSHHEWTCLAVSELANLWPRARRILRSHNDERQFMSDYAFHAGGARRLYSKLEAARVTHKFLDRAISAVHEVWAISAGDLHVYEKRETPARVVHPIAVVPEDSTWEKPLAPTIGFLGALNIPHAVEGLQWFVSKVWPIVVTEVPDARLHVAGRGAPAQLRHRLETVSAVTFVGEVDDPLHFYKQSAVFVNPVFAGSGVNIKVLAPARIGVPIVTTTYGARGLEDLEMLKADDPEQFAGFCVELLTNRESAADYSSRLIDNSSDFTEDSFQNRVASLLRFGGAVT